MGRNINWKILIGSIIAVAILIGVSFTSVVGYSSVKSDVKASPLFTIRAKRAIDEESKDLTCDYIGRGEEITIPIPNRNESIQLILKMFKKLEKMNEVELKEFKESLINLIHQKNMINDKEFNEMKELINRNYQTNNDETFETFICGVPTQAPDGFCTIQGWTAFCYLLFFLIGVPLILLTATIIFLLWLPLFLIVVLASIITSCGFLWTWGP